jgi:prepilin-type N-terminal cleavage/methylation domain-containing protein
VTRALAHRLRDNRGFTLVEMLTSMVILGLLFAVFATVMSTTITQGTQEQTMTELQTQARSSMEQLARELRQAYSGDGSWPIQTVSAGTQTIRFVSPDKLQPFHLRTIEWRLSSGNLDRRSVTSTDTDGAPWTYPTPITSAAWITQARSIKNTNVFQFLDANDAATTTAANVRKVKITLDVATTGQGSRIYRYQTSAHPRVTP